MKVTTIGVDLAKSVFQVHGVDARGHVVVRKQLRREQVAGFFANLPPYLVGLEACGSAHHLARTFADFAKWLRTVTRRQITESPRPPAPAPRRGS